MTGKRSRTPTKLPGQPTASSVSASGGNATAEGAPAAGPGLPEPPPPPAPEAVVVAPPTPVPQPLSPQDGAELQSSVRELLAEAAPQRGRITELESETAWCRATLERAQTKLALRQAKVNYAREVSQEVAMKHIQRCANHFRFALPSIDPMPPPTSTCLLVACTTRRKGCTYPQFG